MKIPKYYALAIIVTIIAASEIGLRHLGFGDPPLANLDPEIEYYLKPNASYNRYGNRVSVNRYGMRSQDFSKEDEFDKTLFLLGDSVIYGNHFLDQSQTIVHHLGSLASGSTTQTLSAAIAASSWGPENILAYYKRFGPFKGDVAFVVQSFYDQTDTPFDPSDRVPYRVSPSMTAISDLILFSLEKIQQKRISQIELSPSTYQQQKEQTELALNELIQLLKQDFESVILVYHVSQTELLSNDATNDASSHFRAISKKNDIEFVDTLIQYKKHPEPETLYRDDIHLSAKGAKFLATMFAELSEQN